MVSYSTKATWLVSKEIAPFGGFYIFSYILVIFSSIFLNLIFAIDYGGFFNWSQTIDANSVVRMTHDFIVLYLIFSYIWCFFKYIFTNLSDSTNDIIRLSFEEFFDNMKIYQNLNLYQYHFVLLLLSILSLSVAILILHLFTMEHGGSHTRVGRMFGSGSFQAIIYTGLMNLAMFFVFIYSFVIWEQRNYVSE